MSGTKAFWKSKGFWGPVVALIAFGVQANGGPEIDQDAILSAILEILGFGGVLLGLYGRTTAQQKLGVRDE